MIKDKEWRKEDISYDGENNISAQDNTSLFISRL
jgi:hypothetical protein